ncbi:MAG: endonuclease, partial [Paludibacteraceae bacterium]|nr:endonuclease [Paludibacteraceae bacterium]
MKKIFFLAALLCAQIGWATIANNTPTSPAVLGSSTGYYQAADSKQGSALFSALTTISGGVTYSYHKMTYDDLYEAYLTSDVYPAGHPNAGKLWDMYSTTLWVPGEKECGNYSVEGDCYNREHSLPKSWFGGSNNYKSTNQGCDLGHLVPTDGKVNSMRSNFAFGEVGSTTYTSNGGLSKLGYSVNELSVNSATISGTSLSSVPSDKVFEPADEYKGDFARIYMYMRARYASLDLAQADGGTVHFTSTTSAANESQYGWTDYSVILLMKWHRQDPVSQKEIDRNNEMERMQGNRNPFIDYPILAEYLWGYRAGQSFQLANALGSFEDTFVPGVSDGTLSGGDTIPTIVPTPTVKYGVTWSINGEETQVDSIKENNKVTSLPDEPTSCSTESNVFMGWTTAPISGSQDDAPAVLYKAAKDIPAITADITYYAVFAHAQTTQTAAPATYTFDADHQDGWSNTGTWTNGTYWLLDDGKSLVSPEIDLAGLSSIAVTMRTYGGTSYNQ